jgi:RNA recognition motif-containing protein
MCHDDVVWPGRRFLVDPHFPQITTSEPSSAFRGVSLIAGDRPEAIMAHKLFIGGLAFSTSTDRLRELFTQAGVVESAAVVTDRDTGNSRGFGFVEMATAEEAAEAVKQLNGKEVDGRTLKVELANSTGAGGGRSGSGGGYRSRGGSGGSGGGRW